MSSLDIDLSTIPPFVTEDDGDSEVAAQRFVDAVAKKLRPEGAGVLSAVMRLRDCGEPPPAWLLRSVITSPFTTLFWLVPCHPDPGDGSSQVS